MMLIVSESIFSVVLVVKINNKKISFQSRVQFNKKDEEIKKLWTVDNKFLLQLLARMTNYY